MTKYRAYSVAFKQQVAQEYLAGETQHALARRYEISRTLVKVWAAKAQAGTLAQDAEAAGRLRAYEARIAALERLVGRQALELEFLAGC